jgi:triosephosphate isomerase
MENLMRKPLIAGNWKMNGSKASVITLLQNIVAGCAGLKNIELAVFPPFVFLAETEQQLKNSSIIWGAQNLSEKNDGAYTGEISAAMLQDFGCHYVLVGHSERRHLYGEPNEAVAAKFAQAQHHALQPVLCVGETLAQREAGQTEAIVQQQLDAVLTKQGIAGFKKAVVAYEPVWAIGTGVTATPEQAQSVHAFIRQFLAKHDENIAQSLRILYGGSLKTNNAASLLALADIDGGLIGGASLEAKQFLEIANSCKH